MVGLTLANGAGVGQPFWEKGPYRALLVAMRSVLPLLPSEITIQMQDLLLSPASIAGMVGVIAGWAVAHAFGRVRWQTPAVDGEAARGPAPRRCRLPLRWLDAGTRSPGSPEASRSTTSLRPP